MQPSMGIEASDPDTTRQGDRNREPAPPTRDAYLRPKSQSTTVYHTETMPRSGHYGSRPVPCRILCITEEYSADSRKRMPRARVSLHIQKPKPQANIKNKIGKIHKLFDVYNAIHKRWVGQLRWQCYRRHQQNPLPCPDSVVSAG